MDWKDERKQEVIDGAVYVISPSPNRWHAIVNERWQL